MKHKVRKNKINKRKQNIVSSIIEKFLEEFEIFFMNLSEVVGIKSDKIGRPY